MTAGRTLRAVLVVGALAAAGVHGLAAIPTSATFGDATATSPSTLTAGTVALTTTGTANWVLGSGATGIYPGAAGALVGAVTVTNTGSLGLRYSIRSTTTENTTAAALSLEIKTGVGSCTAVGFDASGTAAGPTTSFGATGGVPVLGDPAAGAQAGDRTLAAGTAETLCARVSLRPGGGRTDNALAATGTAFTFLAENL